MRHYTVVPCWHAWVCTQGHVGSLKAVRVSIDCYSPCTHYDSGDIKRPHIYICTARDYCWKVETQVQKAKPMGNGRTRTCTCWESGREGGHDSARDMMMAWRATYSCRVAIIDWEDYYAVVKGTGEPMGKAHVRVHGERGPVLPSPDLNYRIRGSHLHKFKRAERARPNSALAYLTADAATLHATAHTPHH
jgi:hypothetical protein